MFYSNVTYNSLKLEATWISSNLIMIKQIVIYLLDRILGTHKNNEYKHYLEIQALQNNTKQKTQGQNTKYLDYNNST